LACGLKEAVTKTAGYFASDVKQEGVLSRLRIRTPDYQTAKFKVFNLYNLLECYLDQDILPFATDWQQFA
jgi:hypothetical protein